MSGNTITIIGNVTKDPELRFTASGQATASFGIAVNRRWQNRQTNDWEEQVSFFNVVTWREMAENVAESLHKGSRVIVTGRLEQRSWETPDGDKRSVVDIVADEIGPSLRWATAQVVRNERRPGDNEGSGGSGAPSAPSSNSSGGSSRQPSTPPPAASGGGYDYDEEPF